jgi:hypothetical protein
MLKNLVFGLVHSLCFLTSRIIESEIVQQAVRDIEGKFGSGFNAALCCLLLGQLAVHRQIEQSRTGRLVIGQIEADDVGDGPSAKEFPVKPLYFGVVDDIDIDICPDNIKTRTNSPDELPYSAYRRIQIFTGVLYGNSYMPTGSVRFHGQLPDCSS